MTSERSGLYFIVNVLRVTYYFSLVCSLSALALKERFLGSGLKGSICLGVEDPY